MTVSLHELIREAGMFGSAACDAGKHTWVSAGGRRCPKDLTDDCSQGVYRCTSCGDYDYGEVGGPGATDCATSCLYSN